MSAFPSDWIVREDGSHYNGGPEWFGYGGRCVQELRLRYIDRSYRATRTTTRSWIVDGIECASAEEAWERLQTPPAFSGDELTALATLTDEPSDLRATMPYELRRSLTDKGAARANLGKYVITDAGRVVLALQTAAPPTDGPKGHTGVGSGNAQNSLSTPIQGSGDSREGGRS